MMTIIISLIISLSGLLSYTQGDGVIPLEQLRAIDAQLMTLHSQIGTLEGTYASTTRQVAKEDGIRGIRP